MNRRFRDRDLQLRLGASKSEVGAASQKLEAAAQSGTTYALRVSDFNLQWVTHDEMSRLYNQRMAQAGGPARHIYDELMVQAEHGICPFCGQRDVSTLDHYMPKALYPALAIDPLNLIPACKDCNKQKGITVGGGPDDEPLHPYFDNIDGDRWLEARVVHVLPTALTFHVSPPPSWPDSLRRRAEANFRRFRIASLYASQSAQEMASISRHLTHLLQTAGEPGPPRASKTASDIPRVGAQK